MTVAFPDAGLSAFAFFALVPMLLIAKNLPLRNAVLFWFYAGIIHYLTLIYWIIGTVHIYGRLPLILAAGVLVGLAAYLAVYWAVFGWAWTKYLQESRIGPVLAGLLWVMLEYVRTWLFTGFPWGALGYSQYENLSFIQVADIGGVYMVSFAIMLVNTTICRVFEYRRFKPGYLILPAVLCIAVIAAYFGYGQLRLKTLNDEMKKVPEANVSVVQGNIRQDVKWDMAFKASTIEAYQGLSLQALQSGVVPDLVIWPETSLPFYYGRDQKWSKIIDEFVRKTGTSFLIGIPAVQMGPGREISYLNRAIVLNQKALQTGTHDKTHLVPFGEYVPFGKYLKFLGKLVEQSGDYSSGEKHYSPLAFGSRRTGVLICFEVLFPSIASGFADNGAQMLAVITNDAWFGESSAALQHFAIAVFRAVENRRSIARAANTGISGFILPSGKITRTTSVFVPDALTQRLPLLEKKSVYTRFGDLFAQVSSVAICLVIVLKSVRKKRVKTGGRKKS